MILHIIIGVFEKSYVQQHLLAIVGFLELYT